LLAGVGSGWAARVFYTDNGSTAIEVALKMAFRRFMADQGLLAEEGIELQV
jgi:dethiobiotin synthetase/adenosylmethionine--8-amino-7-oxononanoate aminotransferase